MNAIKLPVFCYAQADIEQLWSVRERDGIRICRDLPKSQAEHICVALNSHYDLVNALKNCRESMLLLAALAGSEFNSGVPFSQHDEQARAALAKVENQNKT